jgi:cytochrome P450
VPVQSPAPDAGGHVPLPAATPHRWPWPTGRRESGSPRHSANRDERDYDQPGAFDITRDASDHVGFGYGVHESAGQGLTRLRARRC